MLVGGGRGGWELKGLCLKPALSPTKPFDIWPQLPCGLQASFP